MKNIIDKYKLYLNHSSFYGAVLLGMGYFGLSLIFQYLASNYAWRTGGNFVSDLILDNIPVWNVDPIVVEGAALLVLFSLMLVAIEPKRIPFVLKSTALFVLIRAIFITLTHMGPSPEQI